ncbi:uncharacterized protein B0H64DRAFT_76678 [Chaetomium fimeti]|uniref:Uncharacterized protein n=1 Tax=Chaetomium fimeti TaxID=1854472 RepID=A0AAE0LV59_9PEZI|nr:hypothetical protein B0H64DRAFT_76678 [Chaetomium fimeti]
MFLKKKLQTDNDTGTGEIHRPPIHHVANFSYPRTDFVHLYRKEQPGARDSQGSQSSAPPLVEDHGSDISAAEDDPQQLLKDDAQRLPKDNPRQVPGDDSRKLLEDDPQQLPAADVKMWKRWRARERKREEAERQALTNPTSDQQLAKASANPPTTHNDRSVVVPSQEQQRPHAPKPPPNACYSLFPSPSECRRRVAPAPLHIPTVPQQIGLAPSPISPNFPLPPSSRGGVTDWRNYTTATSRPGVSTTKTPGPVHSGSFAASSSDSVPLLLRSPGPTPPHSPPSTSSSSEAPQWPLEPKRCPPPEASPRSFTLAKKTTRSSPSLANLARAQRQEEALEPLPRKPPTPSDIHDRPLPPLPRDRFPPPPPPNVSVFEADTDDEDEAPEARPSSSGDARNFARRVMHGLVRHQSPQRQHDAPPDRGQSQGQSADHKRSVSDEGPSTATGSSSSSAAVPVKDRGSGGSGASGGGASGGRSGISRTLNAAARYRWGGPAAGAGEGDGAPPPRGAVSMDLPREGVRGEEVVARGRSQQDGEGLEKGGRFFGRILRRKG